MDRNVLESQWTQVREFLREKFSNLTEEDIRQINGRYDQLVNKLQQKYGYTREEAEDRIRSWNFDRFSTTPRTSNREESYQENRGERLNENKDTFSPALTWLLALGIPLLLLATYFLSPTAREDRTNAMRQEQGMTETAADRMLSDNVRRSLTNQNLMTGAQNIQITSHNGVVTLSGTVASQEAHDSIINAAQTLPGVERVTDHLLVR